MHENNSLNVRAEKDSFWAGGFLYNPHTQSVLLHKRDNKAPINPNKWGFFGGSSEDQETPYETFIREFNEELGITIEQQHMIPLCDYLNVEYNQYRYVFYITSALEKSEMVLNEGEDFDWIPLNKIFEYDLSIKTKDDLKTFIEHAGIKK